MEKTREYFRSMVSQRGIKQTFFIGDPNYNASWDYMVTKDKRHYFSVCAEGPKVDAMIYEYIPETCELRKCLDTKTAIITYPRTVRPSKVHTCMCEMEDGRIIMNNHTTAGAHSHPDWMTEAYWNHPYEGYPGSNVFIYDPKTGKVEDLGIPVPRESIYGAGYDPIHRAYYFSGYFRGHGYRLDLDTREVTDYGQFSQYSAYFHLQAPDGNVYLSDINGGMLRFNVHNQKAEHMKACIPIQKNQKDSKYHNVFAYGCFGPDGNMYACAHRNENIYRYDYKNDVMTDLGSPVPKWYKDRFENWRYMVFGMDFDSNGILWYGLKILGNCMRFCSWDILNGGEPVDYGIVGTPEHSSWNFCQAHIVDDVFYGATTNHATDGPSMVAIDLKVMLEDVDKPRERALDKIVYRGTADADIYPTGEKLQGRAALDATEGEERGTAFGGHAFADGILRSKPTNNQWKFTAGKKYVAKIWKNVGIDNSAVVSVSHDEKGNVVSVSGGENGFFRTVTCKGDVLSYEKLDSYVLKNPDELKEKYKDVVLPCTAGRSWLAYATAEAPLADGSMLVGTASGGLAIVNGDKVFHLGFASMTSAIHDLTSSPDRRTVYGVCGDRDEYGYIFSYSMDFGLVLHGMTFFENGDGEEGLGCSCEPCCIDFAPDGKSIAIGCRDKLGAVYEYYFEDPENK